MLPACSVPPSPPPPFCHPFKRTNLSYVILPVVFCRCLPALCLHLLHHPFATLLEGLIHHTSFNLFQLTHVSSPCLCVAFLISYFQFFTMSLWHTFSVLLQLLPPPPLVQLQARITIINWSALQEYVQFSGMAKTIHICIYTVSLARSYIDTVVYDLYLRPTLPSQSQQSSHSV